MKNKGTSFAMIMMILMVSFIAGWGIKSYEKIIDFPVIAVETQSKE